MARNVPQFGKWENEDNVPYTVFFDKARKSRGGKVINSNVSEDNQNTFLDTHSSDPGPLPLHPKQRAQREEPIGRGGPYKAPRHRENRDDSEPRHFADSPGRNRGRGGRGGVRPSRASAGSEHSIERSPLHPEMQKRGMTGRGSGNGNGKLHESSNGTNGRTRMKPRSHAQNADGDAIPKFGDWNVNDPQSADQFTEIFNKNSRGAPMATSNSASSHNTSHKQNPHKDDQFSIRSCFPCLGK